MADVPANPYKNELGVPQLRPSVAAFLDILGYKKYIEGVFRDGKGNEELARLRNALDVAQQFLKKETGRKNLARRYYADLQTKEHHSLRSDFLVHSFTDDLVIGYPLVHGDAFGALVMVMFYIEYFQMELARQGYFIREAISIGDLYVDEDIIFGQALLEAYQAEQELAVYPRVILCRSAEEPFRANPMLQDRSAPDVLIDSDGRVFIDYLNETVMIAYPDFGPYTEFLEGHKNAVVAKLKEFSNKPRIRAKYEWTATYHNAFCSSYPDLFDESHRVPATLLAHPPEAWVVAAQPPPIAEERD
jgi:hypothetical protein